MHRFCRENDTTTGNIDNLGDKTSNHVEHMYLYRHFLRYYTLLAIRSESAVHHHTGGGGKETIF